VTVSVDFGPLPAHTHTHTHAHTHRDSTLREIKVFGFLGGVWSQGLHIVMFTIRAAYERVRVREPVMCVCVSVCACGRYLWRDGANGSVVHKQVSAQVVYDSSANATTHFFLLCLS